MVHMEPRGMRFRPPAAPGHHCTSKVTSCHPELGIGGLKLRVQGLRLRVWSLSSDLKVWRVQNLGFKGL